MRSFRWRSSTARAHRLEEEFACSTLLSCRLCKETRRASDRDRPKGSGTWCKTLAADSRWRCGPRTEPRSRRTHGSVNRWKKVLECLHASAAPPRGRRRPATRKRRAVVGRQLPLHARLSPPLRRRQLLIRVQRIAVPLLKNRTDVGVRRRRVVALYGGSRFIGVRNGRIGKNHLPALEIRVIEDRPPEELQRLAPGIHKLQAARRRRCPSPRGR